jgi:hypothetical protein
LPKTALSFASAKENSMTDHASLTVSGSVHSFTFGRTVFAVDASIAGRIVTFSLDGRNILTAPKNAEDNNWGSTFWTSPQSAWNWPPPAEIDPGHYAVNRDGDAVVMSGNPSPTLGLAVTKRFSVDAAAESVGIVYSIVNRGSQPRSVAPWEISRVAAGGLTFFAMGDGAPIKGPQDLLKLDIVDGVAYFAYDAKAITADQKVFSDGHEGWIAHVDRDLLLVKAFSDIPAGKAAPGEAEIEIYADAARTYVEVENQGAYVSLAPGAFSSWNVRWFLRKVDPAMTAPSARGELVKLVRGLVRG